jgi:hypothetical protein
MDLEAVGYMGGIVSFDGVFVSIRRKGLSRLTVGKGEKRIPARSITAVQLKPAGPITNGFIQFTIAGGIERRSKFGRQTPDAVSDENSVIFTRKQQPQFEVLRSAIEHAIATTANGQPQRIDPMDQLRKLAELRDAGIVTEDEFQAKKRTLLA